MNERKSQQYVRQSEIAASSIAKWPLWMQRNLEPPRVPTSGIYTTKGGETVALSKADRVPPTTAGGTFVTKTSTKKKKK